jgi:FKBP-type peptidyl-prolyl cis-trans isomerase
MQAVQQVMVQRQQEQGEKNKQEGKAFLAKNAKKKGVKTLPSGVQYKVIKKGNGKKPKLSDTVSVHYRGKLINGQVFDSSYKRNQPATFPLGGLIKAWQEVIPMMPVGSSWRIFVPENMGYGARGTGGIPPYSTLIFDIELLEIK